MTIYVYCRTSELEASLGQEALDSMLEPEWLAIQTYCLQHSWFRSEAVGDHNCSWVQAFEQRANGARLLDSLQAGDVILCSKLERIVSSSVEAVKLIVRLRNQRVQLHVAELRGAITDPAFMVNFEQVARLFSSLEKRKPAERIKRIKQRQRQQGRYLGGSRPFGYMIADNGRLVEHPLEQQMLRRIMELKQQGKSLRAISDQVSTPRLPVSFKTVQRLLQRRAGQLAGRVVLPGRPELQRQTAEQHGELPSQGTPRGQ